jgi:hypothetical protein
MGVARWHLSVYLFNTGMFFLCCFFLCFSFKKFEDFSHALNLASDQTIELTPRCSKYFYTPLAPRPVRRSLCPMSYRCFHASA